LKDLGFILVLQQFLEKECLIQDVRERKKLWCLYVCNEETMEITLLVFMSSRIDDGEMVFEEIHACS
jgi:hypothetical protein